MFSANVNRVNSKTNIHFKKHKAKPTAMDEYNFRIKISSQAVFLNLIIAELRREAMD
jgi:hypothetical protein